MKATTESLVYRVENLEDSNNLVSDDFHFYIYDVDSIADTLRKFKPYLEKKGLTFFADTGQIDANNNFLDLYLGRGVEVRDGNLSATILVEPVVELTRNRFFKEKGQRIGGWTCSDGSVYHDFKTTAEREIYNKWKRSKGLNCDEEDAVGAKLRKLAYGKLFEKFGDDEEAFGIEAGLMKLDNISSHEFYLLGSINT